MKAIVPVGTSLFDNYVKNHNDDVTLLCKRLKDEQEKDLTKSFVQSWEGWLPKINSCRKKLENWIDREEEASAEIYSLLKTGFHSRPILSARTSDTRQRSASRQRILR